MLAIQQATLTKQTINRLAVELWPGLDEAERAIVLFQWHQWVFTKLANPNLWKHFRVSYQIINIETIQARVRAFAAAEKPLYDAFVFIGLRLLQASEFKLVDLAGELQLKAVKRDITWPESGKL